MDHNFRVLFEKPNLSELNKKFTAVDMHFHSRRSDGMNTVSEIADRARELGIGVAITDHNSIDAAVELDEHEDILSIPGIELTSREGTHILIYFYDVDSLRKFEKIDIRPYRGRMVMSSIALDMEEIVKRARAFHTLIIFPHPYCAAYTGINNTFFSKERLKSLYDAVDGVEVINAGNLKKWNLRSAVLGFNLNMAITGGSDGHSLNQLGRVVTCAEGSIGRKQFLDSVKNKQNRVIGKEFHMLRKATTNGFKLKTNLMNCPDIFEKNLKYSYALINSKSKTLKDNVRRKINDTFKTNLML